MILFVKEEFTSHSGLKLDFKIECDALKNKDWETLAYIISKKYKFSLVYGIPRGGLLLATKLKKYCDPSSNLTLIVDDVLTTGKSMIDFRKQFSEFQPIQGVVVFSRTDSIPKWIDSIFQMWIEE